MKDAKEQIKEAFLHYLREKPYDKIKVSELIKAAEVNRSTFYRYYGDVIDLYNELCKETAAEYISALPPFSREGDAFRFVLMMYERASIPENRELVTLLLGENGSGALAMTGRRLFIEKITADAEAAGIWDERMSHLVSFSADYMVVCGYYLLHREEFNASPLPELDFTFDYTADPLDTMAQILRELCGGSLDSHNALFLSTIRLFSEGDARIKPITSLLRYSGFCRTVFYRMYDDKSDYFAKLESSMNLLVVKAILPIMEKEDVSAYEILLDLWDKYYLAVEQKALYIAFRDGYGFRLAANLITKLGEAYVASLVQKKGVVPDEKATVDLSFFTCGVVCSLVYYYASLDREAFFKRMEFLYSIRRKFEI